MIDYLWSKMDVASQVTGLKNVIFFHARMNSEKLKVDSIIFGWALPKIAMAF